VKFNQKFNQKFNEKIRERDLTLSTVILSPVSDGLTRPLGG